MNLYDEFVKLIETLGSVGAEYAVCGGLAVGIHGHPRATVDIDLLVPAGQIESIKETIRPLGFTVPAFPMTFDPGTPAECRVHRVSKVVGEETITLDLLVLGPAAPDVWKTRIILKWHGMRVCVVSRQGLARMKRLAGRPQDLMDLAALGLDED